MHRVEKKNDISISGEEIFLPTSPEELGGQGGMSQGMNTQSATSLDTTVDYTPLPTKPEEV